MTAVSVSVLFPSGEPLASVQAEPSWKVSELKAAIGKHLPPLACLGGLLCGENALEDDQDIAALSGCFTEADGRTSLQLSAILDEICQPGTYKIHDRSEGCEYEVDVIYVLAIDQEGCFTLTRKVSVGGCGGLNDILPHFSLKGHIEGVNGFVFDDAMPVITHDSGICPKPSNPQEELTITAHKDRTLTLKAMVGQVAGWFINLVMDEKLVFVKEA